MADEALDTQATKKKSGAIKWIILVVLLIVLGVGGWFAWDMFLKEKLMGAPQATEEQAPPEGQPIGTPIATGNEQLVSLPTFIVNLADPLGRRYLKITLDVEVINDKAARDLTAKEARIRDAVILLLSSKSYQDLSTMESKILLKKEVAERLNQALGGPQVLRVYITEMVVQ
ncbi:flagellar basal body-associated protein [Desulfocurvibacter africanus PCS]|uniref:Flagellar protein FliL n=1 Tax=Desulfocurvibacter africanus PCS TaxID=1262666 RepID=M5PW32_DESAF|nr:flagellar basal body-associated FliL family protein [Desulfocurvibacter africanus]EMG38205.1 flagellar basal body-associated protein [Desulfocurvibacter africanus PCS]